MTVSNRGRFSVSNVFFHNLGAGDGVNLFHGMVVLQTQPDFMRNVTEYLAVHEDFEPVPEGCVAPVYAATFGDGEIYPTWSRVND